MAPQPVDVASVPQLNGLFAPIQDEIDADDLTVLQGEVPTDLAGAYLRNGPNPRFDPIGSYTYPLDGDGMVHGLWFEEGRVRYRNRFVRTPTLDAEEEAGRALWGGVMSMSYPSSDEVGPELAARDKDLPDIHVVHHGGRYLALTEGAPPFEIDASLATVGEHTFGGALPKGMCAHPKVDPASGDMVVFRYDFAEPILTWAIIGPDGMVSRPEENIEVDASYMIHDCVITPHHLVLFVAPLQFDLAAAFQGGDVLAWKPELGTRIAVVDRTTPAGQTAPVTWFHTDPFWVWHFANAFETTSADGSTTVVVDYATWSHPGMGLVSTRATGGVERAHLELATGTVRREQVDDRLSEFPRLDDRLIGLRHRYFHVAAKDPDHPTKVAGEWNCLTRYDTESGSTISRPAGATCFGEAIFAPRLGGEGHDDGYVMTYAYVPDGSTQLIVLHAADIAGEPAATIAMPHRVPFGLHGSWVPAT